MYFNLLLYFNIFLRIVLCVLLLICRRVSMSNTQCCIGMLFVLCVMVVDCCMPAVCCLLCHSSSSSDTNNSLEAAVSNSPQVGRRAKEQRGNVFSRLTSQMQSSSHPSR